MQARLTPAALWTHLRSTYWFIPAMLASSAIALGILLVALDRRTGADAAVVSFAYGGGADGARALLSAVAGSMITVVSVTFSVTIVALTVSSQHFGPRLLNSFMRDAPAQLVLGVIIGTFAYCLVVLRTVTGEGDGLEIFVPHLAVTGAVVLALVSVGSLIYFIHHISVALQIATISARISADLQHAIERLYPERLGADRRTGDETPRAAPEGATRVTSPRGGYVQQIDSGSVMTLARDEDVVVWLDVRPGDFVTHGAPVAAVSCAPDRADHIVQRLRQAFVIGPDRTSHQDAAFAVQQLVEIALHALSPGINEPFTAITCIDRLGEGLALLAVREIPSHARLDDGGALRVVAAPVTFAELLSEAFAPIRMFAGRNAPVHQRLLSTLCMLAHVSHRGTDLAALREEADAVWEQASRDLPDARLRGLAIDRAYQQVRSATHAS